MFKNKACLDVFPVGVHHAPELEHDLDVVREGGARRGDGERPLRAKVVEGHHVDALAEDVLGAGRGQDVALEHRHPASQQPEPGASRRYVPVSQYTITTHSQNPTVRAGIGF